MWNDVFLKSQDTILLAIQPAIQPATSISTKVIDDDYKWFLIKFGTLIKMSLFYPSFCFNWIHRHKHKIALSAAHQHPFFCGGKTVMTYSSCRNSHILLYHQHLYFTFYIMIAKFQVMYSCWSKWQLMQKSLLLLVVFSWDSINLLCSTVSLFFLLNQSQVLLKTIIVVDWPSD